MFDNDLYFMIETDKIIVCFNDADIMLILGNGFNLFYW